MDLGLIVHKSPFMADEKDPLVLSTYIFELLEVNPRVAGFLFELHLEHVDAVVESVTAHAEKGAGTKMTLCMGQEEAEEVEEEVEEVEDVGGWRGQDKPHHPLMISVHKVRIRPVGCPAPGRPGKGYLGAPFSQSLPSYYITPWGGGLRDLIGPCSGCLCLCSIGFTVPRGTVPIFKFAHHPVVPP